MRLARHGFLLVLLVVSGAVLVLNYSATTAGLPDASNLLFAAPDAPAAVQALLSAKDFSSFDYSRIPGLDGDQLKLKGVAFAPSELALGGLADRITATTVITDTKTKTPGFPGLRIVPKKINEAPSVTYFPLTTTVIHDPSGQTLGSFSSPITRTLTLTPTPADNFKFQVINKDVANLKVPAVRFRGFVDAVQQGKEQFVTEPFTLTLPGVIYPTERGAAGPVAGDFKLSVVLDTGIPSALEVRRVTGDGDACPDSDLAETIAIDDCAAGVANRLFDDGCTMADLIARCGRRAANHGQFTSCVAGLTTGWEMAGFIEGREVGRIQRCAGLAAIP